MCSLNEAKLFANYTVWAGFVNLELRLRIFKATIKRLLGLLGHLLCTGQYCLLVKKTSVQKTTTQFGKPAIWFTHFWRFIKNVYLLCRRGKGKYQKQFVK